MKVPSLKLKHLVPLLYVALLQIDSVLSFGASLFGNRFLYRAQHYTTKPKQAYRLRKPYQDKYGPYGDNLIHTLGTVPLFQRRPVTSKPFVFAPFGTEGFTISPEEEVIKRRRQERRDQKRRQRGHRPDKRP